MPAQILTPSRARRLLDQYRTSNLTQTAFCRKHRVSTSLFAYWMPRFRAPATPAKPAFQEVRLPPTPVSQGQCALILPSAARLEFPASHLPAVLAMLTGGTTPC